MPVKLKCAECGREFHKTPADITRGKGKFCSLPCRREYESKPVVREAKTCARCGQVFPANDVYFYKHNQKRDGLRPECKDCLSKQQKEAKAKLPGTVHKREYTKNPLKYRAKVLVDTIKQRCKQKGLFVDTDVINRESIEQLLTRHKRCDCCGVVLDYLYIGDNQKNVNAPSIDQIIPGKGYTRGNIALLCWRCNRVKNDASYEEIMAVACWLETKVYSAITEADVTY